ncbi:MAG: S8 family serine peptidase, partial [Nocardioidaceae bacterium]
MTSPRTLHRLAAALVSALVVSAVPTTSVAGASAGGAGVPGGPGPAESAGGGPGTPAAVVTLLTGDRVLLGPGAHEEQAVTFVPRAGAGSGYSVERRDGEIHVVPDDVAELVPDVLDPELFDVTALVAMGYDDASADSLPLIVERAPQVDQLAAGSPLEGTDRLDSVGAIAATLDKAQAGQLGSDLAALHTTRQRAAARALGGATRIWLDGKVEGSALDGYLEQVKAPAAWNTGLDGSGVTMAVLDTGVDDEHPALKGVVRAEHNFSDAPSAHDGHGHGTHVASLMAGNGAGSDGARRGIAPGVELLSGKVLNDDAVGLESWVVAGMEWATAQGADVVNMSLSGPAAAEDDIVVQALENLSASSDTLFVVAAGNRGWVGDTPFTIGSPGTAPSALTVGAVRADDGQAVFSSEG